MSIIDGVIIIVVLVLFGFLTYQRNNGHIDRNAPEPTVLRQLQCCRHSLATAQQSAEIWRTLAEKQKVIIAELSVALENHGR